MRARGVCSLAGERGARSAIRSHFLPPESCRGLAQGCHSLRSRHGRLTVRDVFKWLAVRQHTFSIDVMPVIGLCLRPAAFASSKSVSLRSSICCCSASSFYFLSAFHSAGCKFRAWFITELALPLPVLQHVTLICSLVDETKPLTLGYKTGDRENLIICFISQNKKPSFAVS